MHRVAFAIAAVLLSLGATPAGAQAVIRIRDGVRNSIRTPIARTWGRAIPIPAMVGQRALRRAPHIGPIAITAIGAATDRLRP